MLTNHIFSQYLQTTHGISVAVYLLTFISYTAKEATGTTMFGDAVGGLLCDIFADIRLLCFIINCL